MIPLDLHTGLPRPDGLPCRATAYLDRDWLTDGLGAVPAIVADAHGGLAWHEGAPIASVGSTPDERVARALAAAARDAATALGDVDDGLVAVRGAGALAAAVESLLGGLRDVRSRPRAIVETTGRPESIAEAIADLDDRGVLVLAGEPAGPALVLDLYADVHLRGLELVGVRLPSPDEAERAADASHAAVDAVLASVADLDGGAEGLGRARLFRIG